MTRRMGPCSLAGRQNQRLDLRFVQALGRNLRSDLRFA